MAWCRENGYDHERRPPCEIAGRRVSSEAHSVNPSRQGRTTMASFSNESSAGFGSDGVESLCEDDTNRNTRTGQSSLRVAFYSVQNTVVPFWKRSDQQQSLLLQCILTAAGFALVVLLLIGTTHVIISVEGDSQNRKFSNNDCPKVSG